MKISEPPTTGGRIAEFFTDLLTKRPLAQATHNFMRGLHFHKDYFHHPHFSTWKGVCSGRALLSSLPGMGCFDGMAGTRDNLCGSDPQ